MATYTRDKINKKPVVPQKAATTTQELAKSIAQKEQKPAGIQTQMAQGQPKSPLAGTVSGKELKPISNAPIPAGTKLDQTGVQKFGGDSQIKDQLDMAKTGTTVGNIADKIGDKTISGLETPEAKAERLKREKEAAMEAAKAEAKRKLQEQAKNNAAELEAKADLNGDGVIGTGIEGMAGGRQMTEEDAINTAIRNLLLEQPDVAEERKAMIGEMEAKEARDIQSMRARTGLGGMGLTGAAGALESQVRQESGREQALTTAQFDRAARAEALDRLLKGIGARRGEQVFGAEMEMYESEADIDINGDGFIGGKPVGLAPGSEQAELESLTAPDLPAYVEENKQNAQTISRGEYEEIQASGVGGIGHISDNYFYMVTKEDPPRFIKVNAASIGLQT